MRDRLGMIIDVMIPAFDELPNLQVLLPKLKNELGSIENLQHTIFVIVRCEEEETVLDELRSLGAVAVRRTPTNSFGDAVRTAISSVNLNSDYTLFMDADGSHNPMTVRKLLNETSGKMVDVVIASRYVDGGSTDNHYLLKLMSKTLNFVYGKVLGIHAQDISTNFKLYSSKELKKVSLTCNEFDILEELLLKLKRQKVDDFSIIEVPDHFHNRVYGVSKRKLGPFIIGYVITLFRLRFKIQ